MEFVSIRVYIVCGSCALQGCQPPATVHMQSVKDPPPSISWRILRWYSSLICISLTPLHLTSVKSSAPFPPQRYLMCFGGGGPAVSVRFCISSNFAFSFMTMSISMVTWPVCVCFEKWGLDTKGERGLTCWDGRLRRQNGRRGQALDDLSCSHRSLWRRLPRDRRRRQLFGLRWERRGGHRLLERWPHEVPPFLPCAFHPFGACNANTLHCCSLYLDLFGRRSHCLLHFLGKGRQQLLPDTCHHQAIYSLVLGPSHPRGLSVDVSPSVR